MAKALAKAQPRKNDPDATRENILDIAARELLLLTGNLELEHVLYKKRAEPVIGSYSKIRNTLTGERH